MTAELVTVKKAEAAPDLAFIIREAVSEGVRAGIREAMVVLRDVRPLGTDETPPKRTWEVHKLDSMHRATIRHMRERCTSEFHLTYEKARRDPRLRAHCADASGEPIACDEDQKHDPTGPNIYSKKAWNRYVAHHILTGKPETEPPYLVALFIPKKRDWEAGPTAIICREDGIHHAREAIRRDGGPYFQDHDLPPQVGKCFACVEEDAKMKQWERERDASYEARVKEAGRDPGDRLGWNRVWEREHPAPRCRHF